MKQYEIGAMIGRGNFSRVFFALRRKDDKKCALKLLAFCTAVAAISADVAIVEVIKQQLRGKWFFIENEVEILQMCSHPNICKIIDAYKTSNKYLLVFEYAQNGDLFELIRREGRLDEKDAAVYTSQTASALAYLHNRKIVHRDIKAENLLLYSKKQVQLCDFGLACTVLGPLYRVCGTPSYCAPEVIRETGYGVAVDVWSLGVLLHIMLVGFAPFRSNERNRLFRLITQGRIHFDLPEWKDVSTKARDLLSRMICTTVENRIAASEVASHPWISELGPAT
ncbi:kinase domain protein [Oesophagostomum dentatum]|uniref:Kinase domain protein n=1 Tax=Oesophagostomum dentatum TaxID=61180 RepID=A0A0B1TL20_OESDE|nr:kinase domain protein [Oesophagostomum dentatum]